MLFMIPNFITPEAVKSFSQRIMENYHVMLEGRPPADSPIALTRNCLQLSTGQAAHDMSQEIFTSLQQNVGLNNILMPQAAPPFVFQYFSTGMYSRSHADQPFFVSEQHQRMRSDVALVLFLSAPDSYEGGEFVIDVNQRPTAIKPAAGTLAAFPGDMMREVREVTSGTNCIVTGVVHSIMRLPEQRRICGELTVALALLEKWHSHPSDTPERMAINHIILARDGLVRMWAD